MNTPAASSRRPRIWRPQYSTKTVQVTLRVGEGRPLLILSPSTATRILRAIIADLDADQEHAALLALDTKGQLIGQKVLSSGTIGSCDMTARQVFRAALLLGAVRIIVGHNHPSGDPSPSRDDRRRARALARAGELLGVPLDDFLVVGDGREYFSFCAAGYLKC